MYMKDGYQIDRNGVDLIGKKVRVGPSFASAAKDAVGDWNGYSGELGDEE